MSLADDIRQLHELYQAGALTDEEFAKAKATLLNGSKKSEDHPLLTGSSARGVGFSALPLADVTDNSLPKPGASVVPQDFPNPEERPEEQPPPQRRNQPRPPPEKANNGLALTGFVLGVVSVFFWVVWIIPVVAVAISMFGLGTFDEKKHKNRWMAGVGLALGVIYALLAASRFDHR